MTKTFRNQLRASSSLRRDFVSVLSQFGSMTSTDMARVDSLLCADRSYSFPLVLFADPERPLVFASHNFAQVMLALTGRFGMYVDFVSADKTDWRQRLNVQTTIDESLECLGRADSGLLIAAGHFGDIDVLGPFVVQAVSKMCNAVCVLVCHQHEFDRLRGDPRSMPLLDRMIVCKQSE